HSFVGLVFQGLQPRFGLFAEMGAIPQLRKETTHDFLKALCHIFSLAIRSHGDIPSKKILDIEFNDPSLLASHSLYVGIALQKIAEDSLLDSIYLAKKTMFGYREDDFI
ncbi:hypothetical protein, partial [uncultured Shewanella sp.]|uniref:hypothetical protein n=1 Tax=uncultured Shewanella sp. TaxID=173975 RepID=UPI002613B2C9